MPRPALAATRAMDVLNFMAAMPLQDYSLTELVRHLKLNPASCHALLGAMTRDGYLVRHVRRRTYRLGPALIAIGEGALQCHAAVAAGRDQLDAIVAETGLTCLLTARAGDMLIALASAGPQSHQSLRIGQRVPLIPPLGTPFLAWADTSTVEIWLARAGDAVDPVHLRNALAAVRRRGFAVTLRGSQQGAVGLAVADLAQAPFADRLQARAERMIGGLGDDYLLVDEAADGTHAVGLVSAPVFDAAGEVACTLSVYGFGDDRMSSEVIMHLGRRLRDFGQAASAAGGDPWSMSDITIASGRG